MSISFTTAEVAELAAAISRLEALSSQVAAHGSDSLKKYDRDLDFGPGVGWSGADTVVIEPIDELVRQAEERGDVFVQTVHASALGSAFQAIAGVVFDLHAYDADTKYDLWPIIARDCARALSRENVEESRLCQEAFWSAIRVLRRWRTEGASLQSPIRLIGTDSTDDEDAGTVWFAFGDFLASRWHEVTPTALYIARASVVGWRLSTDANGGAAVQDPKSSLDGIALLLSNSDEARLDEAVSKLETGRTRKPINVCLTDGSMQPAFMYVADSTNPSEAKGEARRKGPDVNLPFFTYGLFMPGQLGFERLKPYVKKRSQAASVAGELWERDGIPLLAVKNGNSTVQGTLLEFNKGAAELAYNEVNSIEPFTQYKWATCDVETGRKVVRANVLEGFKPSRGGRRLEESVWDGRKDPFFTRSLDIVAQDLAAAREVRLEPPFEPEPLLRLQMVYGLLWASVERFCALRYSLRTSGEQSIARRLALFADEPAFQLALTAEPAGKLEMLRGVYRSDDPDERPTKITKDNQPHAGATIRHLYQIRSNVLHRGKESLSDYGLLLAATEFLVGAFRDVLADTYRECSAEL